ncbi:unnamed protein product [Amoebophrya sp. A25]|nr:unnamed protein product [Amoebophrya sp. A25]|eukprot:GSA25T00017647001.1
MIELQILLETIENMSLFLMEVKDEFCGYYFYIAKDSSASHTSHYGKESN